VGLLTRAPSTPTPPSSAATSPGASSSAAVQARALYRQALAAGNASAGFHYVAISTGSVSQTIVGDAGKDGGTQVITMSSTYGTEQFKLVLTGGVVYFQGNDAALQDQLGVAAAKAPTLINQWISVSSGDGPDSVVAPGITVSDQMAETVLVPKSTTATGGGRTRIVGTVATQRGLTATAHLDVDSGSLLPMAYVTLDSGGSATTSTVTFDHWGTAPTATAPAGAVAWSTLGASQPPGGYGNGGATGSQTPQA
jgi:hypothetical protein